MEMTLTGKTMKKSIYIVLAIAALALQACQLIEESFKIGLTATMEPTAIATKTSLSPTGTSGYDVLWSTGDKIGVYIDGATAPTPFTLTSGAGTTTASFSGEGIGSNYLAFYPQSMLSSRSGNTLNITIPSEQTYVPGSFDEDTYPMVASSGSPQLQFRNICSIVRISLIGTQTVSKIVFQTNDPSVKVSGAASVNVSSPSAPTITMAANASDNVVLNTGSVQLSDTPTDFYFVLPPQTYTGGFKVRVYSGEEYIEKSYDSDFTMVRSMVHRAAVFAFDAPTSVNKYLTFTSEGTTTIYLDNYGGNAPLLYYSFDATNWVQWDYSELSFTSSNHLYICGDNPEGINLSVEKNSRLNSAGDKYGISGNIMSLINNREDLFIIPGDLCFAFLFEHCANLTSVPELPATTLKYRCYERMFNGCTSLISAPVLPAMTLAEKCYAEMFYGCTNLATAPELPATTLAVRCYENMFSGCTSLTIVPELPATSLAHYCYVAMFAGCTSLTAIPELPATTLADYCYAAMFGGCTSLVVAPELPLTNLASGCYYDMFSGCSNLAVAPELPATTLADACYSNMFAGCTSLTTAPELPAATLADACYGYMFAGCTSLTTAPELPATTLAASCYYGMFSGCSNLAVAPELPATTLADWCYGYMFAGCTSLTTAPELPATTLAPGCYMWMFSDCSNLIIAPELSATVLASGCYNFMFLRCRLLEVAPVLPATILTDRCYEAMFAGCTSLDYIKCLATDISAEDCVRSWVQEVSRNGIFVKDGSMKDWSTGDSGIPYAWTVENDGETPITANKYLAFTTEGTTTISLENYGGNAPLLYYSTDAMSWSEWDYSELTFSNSEPLYICGNNPNGINSSENKYSFFTSTGNNFGISGDIMSLINKDVDTFIIPNDYCFFHLLSNCDKLITPPSLPATTLTYGCYMSMFWGCSSLTTAPSLPATTLADLCYFEMFEDCTSLLTAPELPATILTRSCYTYMFANCTSLTSTPALPATSLALWCYSSMFDGCTNITYATALPATQLVEGCYLAMFNDCTSLTTAPELPATTLAFICYERMFNNCTSLNFVKCLAEDINETYCVHNWLSGVSSNGTFVKATSMNDWTRGPSGIPTGWTVINDGDIPSGGLEGTDEEDWN